MICFPLDNTEYSAEALGAWSATKTRGIFKENMFEVNKTGDLTISVSPGLACLKMNDYWSVVVYEANTTELTLSPGGTVRRTDRVCVRLNKLTNEAEIVVLEGDPNAHAPVRDNEYDEIHIASITVNAGATKANAVVDLRDDITACGIVSDLVKDAEKLGGRYAWQYLLSDLSNAAKPSVTMYPGQREYKDATTGTRRIVHASAITADYGSYFYDIAGAVVVVCSFGGTFTNGTTLCSYYDKKAVPSSPLIFPATVNKSGSTESYGRVKTESVDDHTRFYYQSTSGTATRIDFMAILPRKGVEI